MNNEQHPTELDLLDFVLGEAEPEVVAHVQSCEECQRTVAGLRMLREGLASAYRMPGEIPSSVREDLPVPQAQPRRITIPWRARFVRVAAAVLLALGVGYFAVRRDPAAPLPPSATPVETAARGDLNEDGAVDVIDGLLLAKHVVSSERPPDSGDVDRSGSIDVCDVLRLMHNVVAIR